MKLFSKRSLWPVLLVNVLSAGVGAVEVKKKPAASEIPEEVASRSGTRFRLGVVDESVLRDKAPQLMQLQRTESLEAEQKDREIQTIEKSLNQINAQLRELVETSPKLWAVKGPKEQFHRQLQKLTLQRQELFRQKEENKERTAQARKAAIAAWIEEVVQQLDQPVDCVQISGIGLSAQDGGLVYINKSSDFIVDLTESVVKLALEKYEVEAEEDGLNDEGE